MTKPRTARVGRPRKTDGQAVLDDLMARMLRLAVRMLKLHGKALGVRGSRKMLLEALSKTWNKSTKTIEDRMTPARRINRKRRA